MSLLDKIAASKKWTLFFFACLSAFFFIGLGHVHLFDWDEVNFAESAREMIKSGDYLHVQINFLPFWEKPPFFFWLQVLAMKLFGVNEFAARFPNALFGVIYLLTFYSIGKRHFNAKFGIIWALIFFASLLPHLYFKSGIIDPVFNYFIFLSVYFLIRVFAKDGEKLWRFALLAGVCSGISVLTKGPVGFLLFGLTFAVYVIWTRFRNFPRIIYFVQFIAGFVGVISIWVLVEVSQNGLAVLQQFIEYQIDLFQNPVAGHEQPFYYHFVIVSIGCFPMSIFALPMFFRRKEVTALDLRRWMLCLFWVVMILFSITTTKIAHYSSMTYAPLSFLATLGIYSIMEGESKPRRFIHALFLTFGIILSSVFIAIPILLFKKEWLLSKMKDPFAEASLNASAPWYGWEAGVGVFFLIFIIIAGVQFARRQYEKGITLYAIASGLTLLGLLFLVVPKIESISQGPSIGFFKEKAGKDCYVETYGFKSYAQYFYFDLPPDNRIESKAANWLLEGEIDKPVYMVSKITNAALDEHPNFTLLKVEGGFRFYKREVP